MKTKRDDGDCVFCRIVEKKTDADILYEDDTYLAFNDLDPKAPTHVLVIPKRHIASLDDLDDQALGGGLLTVAAGLARRLGHAQGGYRTVINCQPGAGQSVFHIHLHLLAGRPFEWPPG
jgi:histidine triad (HIT) family protein